MSKHLCSSESEEILKYLHLYFPTPFVDYCFKLIDLLDDVRLKWKSTAEELELYKERVNDLEQRNKKLTDHINKLTQLTNLETNRETPSNCAPIFLPCYLSLNTNKVQSDIDTIKVDDMNVNVESPIRNKRSSKRLSDEPTPKIRIESAPLAKLDECSENENHEIYSEILEPNIDSRISTNSESSASTFVVKGKESNGSSSTYVIKQRESNDDSHLVMRTSSVKSSCNFTINKRNSDIPFSDDELEQDSPPQTDFIIRKKLRRSVSLNDLMDRVQDTPVTHAKRNLINDYRSTLKMNEQTKSYKEAVTNKPHEFITKRVLMKLSCMACDQPFKFGYEVKKCKSCKLVCHPKCTNKLVMCIPFKDVPKNPEGRLKLVEYCADTRPRLPHPVLRLVTAMDSILGSRSLYVMNANEDSVNSLFFDSVYKRAYVNISKCRPEVISKALLKFLSGLRDPLILRTSLDEFINACDYTNIIELENAVNDLPVVHKNTLAFLCLHWKKVLNNSEVNGIQLEDLGRIISPVLMRVSPTASNMDSYVRIFSYLVNMDNKFWENIIEQDTVIDGAVNRSNSRNYVNDKLVRCTTTSQITPINTKRMN